MNERLREEAMAAHMAWCRKEHTAALSQIELFTAGGAKAFVQNEGAPLQDITDRVVEHGRDVAQMMGAFLTACDNPKAQG